MTQEYAMFPKRQWARTGVILFMILACIPVAGRAREIASEKSGEAAETYICPPCGCDDDGKAFPEKGSCPACGMALVASSALGKVVPEVRRKPLETSGPNRVAILVFPGVQIIDYTGPFEVFGQAGFETFTVWEHTEPLETNMGMKIIPNYSFENCPPAMVFVIPGGGVNSVLGSDAALEWISKKANETEHVLTVCNGAFILAKTGLIDGKSATTFYRLIDSLKAFAPEVDVVSDQRYVDNGKYVTTAGISSGIDGSLHMVSKIRGLARAQAAALNMEYEWKQDSGYARADFADRRLVGEILSPRFYPLMDAGGTVWELLKTDGDRNRWTLEWRVETEPEGAKVMETFANLVREKGWHPENGGHEPGERTWRFASGGETWRASALSRSEESGKELFTLNIRRIAGP